MGWRYWLVYLTGLMFTATVAIFLEDAKFQANALEHRLKMARADLDVLYDKVEVIRRGEGADGGRQDQERVSPDPGRAPRSIIRPAPSPH